MAIDRWVGNYSHRLTANNWRKCSVFFVCVFIFGKKRNFFYLCCAISPKVSSFCLSKMGNINLKV